MRTFELRRTRLATALAAGGVAAIVALVGASPAAAAPPEGTVVIGSEISTGVGGGASGAASPVFVITGDLHTSVPVGESRTITVTPGSYTMRVQRAFGWELTAISCDDPSGGFDAASGTASFSVADGDTVNCTLRHLPTTTSSTSGGGSDPDDSVASESGSSSGGSTEAVVQSASATRSQSESVALPVTGDGGREPFLVAAFYLVAFGLGLLFIPQRSRG